eukprot:TRINITY_DN2109_c1_g1_i2.p1 TRINITY_DN2109_c1_g1~~TRINITY_DN2109_c1_g1_i2.p1  ORF type:complete len:224 (+),score=35.28 TRINITY_DN2109_c1_g1_i2:341-1012(+)
MEEGSRLLQYGVQVIFNESMNILSIRCIKCLSLVSKSIHNNVIKPYIERNYWFDLRNADKRVTHYRPKKIRDILGLSQVTLSPSEKNDPIKQSYLNSITHLEFHMYFDKPIETPLPPNVTFLKFGVAFDQPIKDNILPPNLTHIEFSFYFNKHISSLPDKITHIQFGRYFSQPLTTLPPSVVQVTFQGIPPKFNHPVSHLNPNIKFQVMDFQKNIEPYVYKPK